MTSREQTARYLADIERISERHFDAWQRHERGVPDVELAESFSVSDRTLRRWRERVNDAIETEQRGRPKFGHTIAQGSKTRHVDDPTPQKRVPRSKFPSAERLRETKKRPR